MQADALDYLTPRCASQHFPCHMNSALAPLIPGVANAEERARLWPLVTADHKNYAGYQTKTEREIPLVLLEPAV